MKLKQFNVQLILRLTGVLIGLLLLAFGFAAGFRSLVLGALIIIVVVQVISLQRYIDHSNRELGSFLAGLKFGDFQQTFTIAHLGPSFAALEETLQQTVQKFKDLRTEKEKQAIYYKALVQHIPVPLFVVHAQERVEILNNAARRAFNVADISNTGELANFGAGFQRDVLQVQPGEALLTTIELAGTQEFFIMTATHLTTGGINHKLISLQNIQSELDATELATWQNLLRVTSHEIINSLAPVSSCAQTAKALVDGIMVRDIQDRNLQEELHDIRGSLDTVLRRSQGLTRFIQSYRQLSRMPPPKKKAIQVSNYLQRLESLVRGELARKDIELVFHLEPGNLKLVADQDMLDQVLINLIRNAADVLTDTANATITVAGYIDKKQRTVLDVQDNGPGVPEKIVESIFVPFFTTKNQGSGIGLALVRYIMLSHGGAVVYVPGGQNGSVFRLIF